MGTDGPGSGRYSVTRHRGPAHVTEWINDTMAWFCPGREMVGLPAREAWPDPQYDAHQRLMDAAYLTGEPQWMRWHGTVYGVLPRWQDGRVIGVSTVWEIPVRLLQQRRTRPPSPVESLAG